MNTSEFWQGQFGNEYHKRNRVDYRRRIVFWEQIIELTGARSVFELGCGPGWNLSAIRHVDPLIAVYGCEINAIAEQRAKYAGIQTIDYQTHIAERFDLVFTAGCLIHIAPDDLHQVMTKLIGASANYVLAIEYDAYAVTAVEYRGHQDVLWKRPYKQLYEQMGLEMVMESGLLSEFDNSTAWLLRKPS